MRRGILLFGALLAASCGDPKPPTETDRLVTLIKAQEFEEAEKEPDKLAAAFVESLRQLEIEVADPKQIVAVADRFFDSYPFCARDLELDEHVIQAVADSRCRATLQRAPSLDSCAELKAARTFVAKLKVLETWPETHRDGGRCAREVVEFLDRVIDRGPEWFFDGTLTGQPGPVRSSWAHDLWEACWKPFDDDPQVLLLAFRVSRLAAYHGNGKWDSWCGHHQLLESDRWGRLFRIRRAWLAALRFRPPFDDVEDLGEILGTYKYPRMRELGTALAAWAAAGSTFRSELKADVGKYQPLFLELDRLASGTPLPDVVRFSLVCPHVEAERFDEVERLVRELRPGFSHPFFPGLSLLIIASSNLGDDELLDSDTNHERAGRLAREVLAWDPRGPTAAMAHYVIGWTQSGPEREAEKISSMQAAVSVPKDVSPYEHTMDAEARSRAGLILAHHYESRKEWSRALEMWRAWLSHATCGLHVSENRESRSLGIARCLDALGRIDEAKLHYWEGTSIAHCEDLASAERLIEIHRELQTESELIAKVRTQVTWLLQHEYEVKGAMKCFADELGVPTR